MISFISIDVIVFLGTTTIIIVVIVCLFHVRLHTITTLLCHTTTTTTTTRFEIVSTSVLVLLRTTTTSFCHTTTISFEIISTRLQLLSSSLLLLNLIGCATLSVSISFPVCVLCCYWIRCNTRSVSITHLVGVLCWCTTRSVSIAGPVSVLCWCTTRSVVLLVLLYYYPSRSCSLLLYYSFGFDYPPRLSSRVLCCCSVALLYLFWFPFPLVFFFLPSSYSIIGYPCLLCSISTTKRMIVITRHVRSTYRSVSLSCRTGSCFLYLRVLLRPPTPTDTDTDTDTDTPTPLSFVIVKSILNLIRTHLSRRPNLLLHISVTSLLPGALIINPSSTYRWRSSSSDIFITYHQKWIYHRPYKQEFDQKRTDLDPTSCIPFVYSIIVMLR